MKARAIHEAIRIAFQLFQNKKRDRGCRVTKTVIILINSVLLLAELLAVKQQPK